MIADPIVMANAGIMIVIVLSTFIAYVMLRGF